MLLLPANSQDAAQALNDTATAYVQGQGNHGSAWSDLWTDGSAWAIVWDNSIAPAFTITADGSGNMLVNGTALIAPDQSWAQYVPPPPVSAPL